MLNNVQNKFNSTNKTVCIQSLRYILRNTVTKKNKVKVGNLNAIKWLATGMT